MSISIKRFNFKLVCSALISLDETLETYISRLRVAIRLSNYRFEFTYIKRFPIPNTRPSTWIDTTCVFILGFTVINAFQFTRVTKIREVPVYRHGIRVRVFKVVCSTKFERLRVTGCNRENHHDCTDRNVRDYTSNPHIGYDLNYGNIMYVWWPQNNLIWNFDRSTFVCPYRPTAWSWLTLRGRVRVC